MAKPGRKLLEYKLMVTIDPAGRSLQDIQDALHDVTETLEVLSIKTVKAPAPAEAGA